MRSIAIAILLCQVAMARPNVIIFVADDVGAEACTPYGSSLWDTPNIDSLADNGIRFNNFYSMLLCAPTRASMLTARDSYRRMDPPVQNAILGLGAMDTNEYTIADMLGDVGYDTFFCGKWNLTYGGGLDTEENFTTQAVHIAACGFDNIGVTTIGNTPTFGNPTNETDYLAWRCMDSATNFIAGATEPWFVLYSSPLSHVTQEYGTPGLPPTPLNPADMPDGTNNSNNFYYCQQYMDFELSNLVATVTDAGSISNTVIMFLGDNGTTAAVTSKFDNVDVIGGKASFTDKDIRVPFYWQHLGTTPTGLTYDVTTSVMDIMPTLAEVCDATLPTDRLIDGKSFYSVLDDGNGEHRKQGFTVGYSWKWADKRLSGTTPYSTNGLALYDTSNWPFSFDKIESPNIRQGIDYDRFYQEYYNWTNKAYGDTAWGGHSNEVWMAQ